MWVSTREHDPVTRERVETAFRCHVYEDPRAAGVDAAGGNRHRRVRRSACSPGSRVKLEAWLRSLKLHGNTKALLFDLLSSVFKQAVRDHIVIENPFAGGIDRPKVVKRDVAAWPAGQVAGVAAQLPAHLAAMPMLAAACGHRQAEAFAVAVADLGDLRRMCRVDVQLEAGGRQARVRPAQERHRQHRASRRVGARRARHPH